MTVTPKWAQELTSQVAIDEGRNDLPEIIWRKRRRPRVSARAKLLFGPERVERFRKQSDWKRVGSSGHCRYSLFGTRIVITAGTDRKDQKLVLLHELAHWLSPKNEGHGPAFWDKTWELFRRYNVPIRYAKKREGNYRKGAIAAYKRSIRKAA